MQWTPTALLAGLLVILAEAALANAAAPGRRNVLLVVTDDQRPDTIAALGNPHIHTPNLDRLVARGTTFTRAICANPICTPSRAELLTGVSGFTSGVRDFGGAFRDGVPRWAETMRRAGWHTWYVGKWHNKGLPRDHGYEETDGLFTGGGGKWWVPTFDWNGREVTGYRGWLFRENDGTVRPERGVGLSPGISAKIADAAIRFINRRPDKPFFLHVNFTAPHDPLLMPFGYAGRYAPAKLPLPENFLPRHPFDHGNLEGRDERLFEWPRTPEMVRDELAVYYAVITHMDEQLGRILDALDQTGQSEDTLVIFTSDHGLAVGSHGLRGKQSMYEHTIQVPLIFRGPGISTARRTPAQCYLRDLFPTVCDLCGIAVPAAVEGKSLKPVLEGTAESVHPFVVGYFRDFQRMLRTDRWKLIHYPHLDRTQLFDLANDPHELHDLSRQPAHQETLSTLNAKLRDWQQKHNDPPLKK
ncbi:MAG: sulfatase-like hydrolase/transferase [Planctomycetes bacterium]|nr:sulfatase-like hydrolase/transferase [Planctomycetota bacterium]